MPNTKRGDNLDIEIRGLISEVINYVFEKQDVLKTINWILGVDDQVISEEDLALGYFMGSLMTIADNVASRKKLIEKLDKRTKKALEKGLGKERAAKSLEEQDRRLEIRARGGRHIKTELTEEETNDIRNMLIPMIAQFREKIRKEMALGQV